MQKQIACGPSNSDAFRKELENLALLTHLKHPNIIPLFCSYVYHDHYNFIFQVAEGGSLADLLDGKAGTYHPEGPELLLALTGLASAIDAIHNFRADTLDARSGCHHDLAPRNILIHDNTLLLADFGLSTFKDLQEDSQTTFKDVHGTYIAPECQALPSLTPQRIGRAGDIWSLGCIMSELYTYMMWGGASGIRQFQEARRFELTPGIQCFRFYQGSEAPSAAVRNWLEDLWQKDRQPHFERLVCLIKKMLSHEPAHRPRSAQVLTALQTISIMSLAASVHKSLNAAYASESSVDRMLDKHRFTSWQHVFQRLVDSDKESLERLALDFDQTIQALQEMKNALSETEDDSVGVPRRLRETLLRHQHSKLMEALPSDSRVLAKDYLVKLVLQEEDAAELDNMSQLMSKIDDDDIGRLLALRRLVALDETGGLTENETLRLDHRKLEHGERIEIHQLATIKPTSERVIVEWLRCGEPWADDKISEVLRRRLASVVAQLNGQNAERIPGALACRGIFYDPIELAIGVAYHLPEQASRPVTLHSFLKPEPREPPLKPRGKRPPLLEHRFRLARNICQSIYTLHQVGWLHRNIHSTNILLFPSGDRSSTEWVTKPRILGFGGSRENRLDAWSLGPDVNSQLRRYQDPQYSEKHQHYREDFDYYSIGIVLLEIGLWDSLCHFTDTARFQDLSAEAFRRELMAERVPSVGYLMGTQYMEAVRACLEGGFGQEDDETPYLQFKEKVIDQILQI